MRFKVNRTIVEIALGDITDEDTDAIVNAANTSLQVGGGVDAAILEVGGREILEECRELGGCDIGDAKITGAGNLNAQYVIHAVGPVYIGGGHGEPDLLASAYRRSLEVARENGCASISFPSLATGAHAYPVEEAAQIALKTVADFVQSDDGLELVRFVLFDEHIYGAFCQVCAELGR